MRHLDAACLGNADDRYDGPIIIGEDRDFYSLRAGSTDIERGSWF
ncbi:hypothetical protein [Sphingopyxis sp.]